jgi:hypothetical protein
MELDRVIKDHGVNQWQFRAWDHPGQGHMSQLQNMIEELSRRADDNDLIALLATNRQARLYNAHLARELRDVVSALKVELDRYQASVICRAKDPSLLSARKITQ